MDPIIQKHIQNERAQAEVRRHAIQFPDKRSNKGLEHFKADPHRKWVYVQLSDIKFLSITWTGHAYDITHQAMTDGIEWVRDHCKHGNEVLLRSGAKGYYRGGGWWLIQGYASGGSDVVESLKKLNLM